MASIQSYIDQILSAIYGREVRDSIANALKAMNVETESATSTANTAKQSASSSSNSAAQSAADASAAKKSAESLASKFNNLDIVVEMLPPEETADANVTDDGSKKIFTFKIPKGDKGDPGEQGPPGPAGTGNVSSVNGILPDEDGDVSLSASDVGALYPDPDDQTTEIDPPIPINADTLNGVSLSEIMLKIYPVGAIYISTASIDPSALFGGVWEAIKDRFLLASGDSYTAGSVGGEASHQLTTSELPFVAGSLTSHSSEQISEKASQWYGATGVFSASETFNGFATARDKEGDAATSVRKITFQLGGDQPHNNMPPYLAVYMWKRVS